VETSNRFEAFVEEDKDFPKVEDAVRLPQSNGCYTEKVKGHVDFKKKMTMTRDGWMKIDKSKKRRKQKNAKEISVVEKEREVCEIKQMRAEITVDSAAEESVCPQGWAEQFGFVPVVPGCEIKLVTANGGKIQHYGKRNIIFQADKDKVDGGVKMGLGFEVTDVRKPLASVSRICEKGNIVQFGPAVGDNFIMNKKSLLKVLMKKKGNSYVIQGDLVDNTPFQGRDTRS
jgi:hypothetical protein